MKGKIIFKLGVGYTLIIIVSITIVGIYFSNLFKDNIYMNKEREMIKNGRNIARISSDYILKHNDIDAYKEFIDLLDMSVNSRIWVLNTKGDVIAMSKVYNCTIQDDSYCNYVKDDKNFISSVFNGEEVTNQGFNNYFNEPVLSVGVPIYDDSKQVVGGVFLFSPLIGISGIANSEFSFLVKAIIAVSILTGILSLFYSKIIVKPLVIMNKATREIMKGNYFIRVNLSQKDEIGELGCSIDLLASKLGNTIEELYQESGKLNNLISSISEGILSFGVDFELLSYNESAKGLFEHSRQDDISKIIMNDLEESHLLDDFKSVICTGKRRTVMREINLRKLRFSLSPVINTNKEIIGVVALIHDMSENERLEYMRREFLANVSHELRTPLTIIQGSAEALLEEVVEKESDKKRYYTRILHETEGLKRMVCDLMDLSKLESGKLEILVDNVDIISLITEVSKNMQIIADKKMISIETTIGQNVPPILGDYGRLKQMLIIFLDNAIKYSTEGNIINISIEMAEEYVYIKIEDNGIGIPKEDIPFIWDRFYKADKSRVNSNKGTGLGLSIAKHLIELHNGVVYVKSEQDKGTTFEIGLPISK